MQDGNRKSELITGALDILCGGETGIPVRRELASWKSRQENCFGMISWQSSNPKVDTVDENRGVNGFSACLRSSSGVMSRIRPTDLGVKQ